MNHLTFRLFGLLDYFTFWPTILNFFSFGLLTYSLTCQMWLQVMEHPLILLHFFGFFIRNQQQFMSEAPNFYKLCKMINVHSLVGLNARCDCKLRKVIWIYCVIWWHCSYIITCMKCYNFIKLSQILCWNRGAKMKIKPM